MSKGLGDRQREITYALEYLWGKKLLLRFKDILVYVSVIHEDEGELPPEFERSLRRSLTGLVKRGDVVVVFGDGSPKNPRQYMNVEDFAKLSGKKPRDTADAKRIAAGGKRFAAQIYCLARAEAERRSHRARHAARATRPERLTSGLLGGAPPPLSPPPLPRQGRGAISAVACEAP
jgi:hypothetical protein